MLVRSFGELSRPWPDSDLVARYGGLAEIEAWHNGYVSADGRYIHHRRLALDRAARSIKVLDWLDASAKRRFAWPFISIRLVDVALEDDAVKLRSGGCPILPVCRDDLVQFARVASASWRIGSDFGRIFAGLWPARAEQQPHRFGRARAANQVLYTRIVFQGVLQRENCVAAVSQCVPHLGVSGMTAPLHPVADLATHARRVPIIVQNLPVPFDRRVWLEATTLAKAGYSVTVICPKLKGLTASYEMLEDVEIHRYALPISAQGFLSFAAEFAWCFVATTLLTAKVALFRRGFDVVQVCNPPETFWPLGLLCRAFGKVFVFDHHDLSPEMFAAKFDRNDGLCSTRCCSWNE